MAKKKAHDEADEVMEKEIHKVEEVEKKAAPVKKGHDDESDVKRPKLNGRTEPLPKPDFEQPGTDNVTRTVIE